MNDDPFDPDDLDDHLATLVRLRSTGADVYDHALQAARVAVAKVVLAEAHRLAARRRKASGGNVVPFRARNADNCRARDEEA